MKRFMVRPDVVQMKNQVSLQKKDIEKQTEKQKCVSKLQKVVGNGATRKYHLLLRAPFKYNPTDQIDTKLLWKAPLLSASQCRKRLILIRDVQYIIPQWMGDEYPRIIYIVAKDVPAYRQAFGIETPRVAALQLVQIAPSNDSAIKTYDLRYKTVNTTAWQIPLNLQFIELQVFIDTQTTAVELPLPNDLSLNIQLIYE